MAGHMECIGIQTISPEIFSGLIMTLVEQAASETLPDGGTMAVWSSPSGARLTVHTDKKGAIQCATPSFDGASRLRVRPLGILRDAECAFCDMLQVEVLDENGLMVYPLPLQIDDIGMTRNRIPLKAAATMRISAFAEELKIWPDPKSYDASVQEEGPRCGSQSLIPSGLFGPAPNPHALLTGHVHSAEERINDVTGNPFLWLLVDTYGGSYDVLLARDQVDEVPAAGSVVQGTFWMVGRVLEGLIDPPPRKKRFGFFG